METSSYFGPEGLLNLEEICRLCRNSRGVMSYIYSCSGVDSSVPLSQRIMTFANVKMREGDGLPSLICHRCLYHIEKVNEFKQLCEQSDALLRQYLAFQVGDVNEKRREMSSKTTITTLNHINGLLADNNELEITIKQERVPNGEPFENGVCDEPEESDGHESEDGELNCPSCNKRFEVPELLNRHMLIHSQEGPFPCDFCDIVEQDKASLRSHWREHCGPTSQSCQTCGENFPNKEDLQRHSICHEKTRPYHCSICMKSFSYRSDLRKHSVIHTGLRPYICPICYKAFTRSTNLNKHTRLHTGRRPFACNGCDKMFASRGDLLRHSVVHTGEKPYICNICSIAFSRKDKLSRHEKLHIGERAHSCPECPTSFNRKEELTKHFQFHHFTSHMLYERGLTVSESQMSSRTNNYKIETDSPESEGAETEDVVINVDPSHWDERRIPDNKENDLAPNLKYPPTDYINGLTGNNDRIFCCEICQKQFRRKRELVRHSSVHTGYRPHCCPTCGKAFARSDKLKRHLLIHLRKMKEPKPGYILTDSQCHICYKVLSSKRDLRRHILTHSKTKPFQCSMCSSSYCRRDKLVVHIKSAHPDTVQNANDSPESEGAETEDVVINVDPSHWAEESIADTKGNNLKSDNGRASNTHESMDDDRVFCCESCPKRFRQKKELVRHSAIHTGYRPHKCSTCGKAFARSDKLKRHLAVHQKKKKEPKAANRPQCTICFRSLSTKRELRRHILTHAVTKPYQCNHCTSSYCRRDKLIKHIKRSHRDKLKFV